MSDIRAQYDSLLRDVAALGTSEGVNLVAFSGGVDSSLVAKAVFDVFPANSEAVLALSPSVPRTMRESASEIAALIGIPLRTVDTAEHLDPTYIANEGMSCYVCKSHIYMAMKAVAEEAQKRLGTVLLFNGNNAEDLQDATRVGIRAAREHAVRSPLERFTKQEVRALSRHAGLPNWATAASPCLRSRLHAGVPATGEHLRRIEEAEQHLREQFGLADQVNFRVRHLPGDEAIVEIDASLLDRIGLDRCRDTLYPLGFTAVGKRAFRSGSVSALPTDPPSQHPSSS